METLDAPWYDFLGFMASEAQLLKWKFEGLPIDELSAQNAVCILNNSISPLVVDPSSQVLQNLASKVLFPLVLCINKDLRRVMMGDSPGLEMVSVPLEKQEPCTGDSSNAGPSIWQHSGIGCSFWEDSCGF